MDWWLGTLYMIRTRTVRDGWLYLTDAWRATNGCPDLLWAQETNWLELWRNRWSANPPVISMLSHSAFLPAFCYQDMDKGERENRELEFQNVEKVQRLLKFTGMSDYQKIAESTALCSLVACTAYTVHMQISLIHEVLAWLTVLTGSYLLCMLEPFYIYVHILSPWSEMYFFPPSNLW